MLTKEEIQVLIRTLEKVEVHGYDNLNFMLGVIGLLRQKLEEEKVDG